MKKRLISIMLTMCMILALCPVMVSAAIPTLKENRRGGASVSVSSAASYGTTMSYNVAGAGGKLTSDKIFTYTSTAATTGGGYFSMYASEKESTHDADSVVHELNFYLTDENTTLYYSPSLYNSTGYDYFLTNGQHTTTSGKGYFKSHNDYIQFSANGVYINATSEYYTDPAFRGQYLVQGLAVNQWHTVAIKLPGLVNSVGEPYYDENGQVVAGKYAGGREILITVDGVEYVIPLAQDVYGTRHTRVHARGTVYLDNLLAYKTSTIPAGESYNSWVQMPEISTASEILRIDGDYVKYMEDITVGDLKASFTGADAIRIYDDATCTTLLEDNVYVEEGDVLVATSKSGDPNYEKTYKYYTLSRLLPLEIEGFNLSEENGKILKSTQIERDLENQTYYLDTTIKNNTSVETEDFRAALAVYDENMDMIHFDYEDFTASSGVNVYNAENIEVKFEGVDIPKGATLKAFLWKASDLTPLCDNIEAYFGSDGEYHILAFGNSYTNDSFMFLSQIGQAAGVTIKAVNMYKGSCAISTHNSYMKNSSKTYESRIEYLPSGKITTEDVSFADGLNTEEYSWDYITLHQRSLASPDYSTFYTDANPYITEIAEYIGENAPSSEFMFFENWGVYTGRIEELYDDSTWNYKRYVEGLDKDEYYETVFGNIRNTYLTAAEKIGNPNRIIPGGEAVYLAITKYGIPEYVDDSDPTNDSFKSTARAMYRDKTSHLTYMGRILAGLTWYEYLTGNDARENPYQNTTYVSAADMALLKEIAHEACQMSYYNK